MRMTVEREIIEALWQALAKPEMGSQPQVAAGLGQAAADAGWFAHLELEALLIALEPRLYEVRPGRLAEAFGVRAQWVYPRPKVKGTGTFGIERIAAADVAYLLILLERLGFAVDPAPVCEPLLAALKARPYLTAAELAVLWHARERHRCEPLELTPEPDFTWNRPDETLSTDRGYRVGLFRDSAGQAQAIRAVAPRRRRPSSPLFRAA